MVKQGIARPSMTKEPVTYKLPGFKPTLYTIRQYDLIELFFEQKFIVTYTDAWETLSTSLATVLAKLQLGNHVQNLSV